MKKTVAAWLGVFLLIYTLLELFFLHYVSYLFPRAALDLVPLEATLLVQHSKKHVIPEDYIAVLGDSYAYGQGDWLYGAQHDIRPAYSAVQVLHKKTGRDVVSFGYPASDSIRAYNILPEVLLSVSEQLVGKKIPDPSQIIVYFYEGNDVNDNVEVMAMKQLPPSGSDYQRDVLPLLIHEDPMLKQAQHLPLTQKFLFARFVKNLAIDVYARTFINDPPAPRQNIPAGETTVIRLAGQETRLPDRLQTPALTLSKIQINDGIHVFGESLRYLRNRFPDSTIGVVYIPAVITPYEVISASIDDYYKNVDGSHIVSSRNIQSNSSYICERIRNHALAVGAAFVDARSPLRDVARDRMLHGPFDWNHFNRSGYETLADILLVLLDQMNHTGRQHELSQCIFTER